MFTLGCDEDGTAAPTAPTATGSATAQGEVQRIRIEATSKGFVPAEVHFSQHRPAVLVFVRTSDSECVRSVKMPWQSEAVDLPMNEPVEITIPDTSKAGTFVYACWMNMLFGRVFIDPA